MHGESGISNAIELGRNRSFLRCFFFAIVGASSKDFGAHDHFEEYFLQQTLVGNPFWDSKMGLKSIFTSRIDLDKNR